MTTWASVCLTTAQPLNSEKILDYNTLSSNLVIKKDEYVLIRGSPFLKNKNICFAMKSNTIC